MLADPNEVFATDGTPAIIKYVSITEHFQTLLKGIIDTRDLAYFATVLLVGIFLTQRSVESVRWR